MTDDILLTKAEWLNSLDREAAVQYILDASEKHYYKGGLMVTTYQAEQIVRHVFAAALGQGTDDD